MIDSQVHLIDPARYPFPDPPAGYVPTADETGTLNALLDVMDAHKVARAVLVPASVYGADNRVMLDAFKAHPDRFRVIAGVGAIEDVAVVTRQDGVVGVRLNLVNSDPIPDDIIGFARAIVDHHLVLQLQAAPAQICAFIDGLDRPSARIVLDHFGRPDLANNPSDMERLTRLADSPSVYLKASAAFRLQSNPEPGVSDTDALTTLVRAFGKDRILWGSDWPFINTNLADVIYAHTADLLAKLVGEDWQAAADANATSLFGWQT